MDEPKTVKMESLQKHTLSGITHEEGEIYEVPEIESFSGTNFPELLENLRYARRVQPATPTSAAQLSSEPIEPMTTDNVPLVRKRSK